MSWWSSEASGSAIQYLQAIDYAFMNPIIAEYKKVPSNPLQNSNESLAYARQDYLNYFYNQIDNKYWQMYNLIVKSSSSGFFSTASSSLTGLATWNAMDYPRRFMGMKQLLYQNLSPDDKLTRQENLDRYERGYEQPKVFGVIPLNTVVDAMETAAVAAAVVGTGAIIYQVGSAIATYYATSAATGTALAAGGTSPLIPAAITAGAANLIEDAGEALINKEINQLINPQVPPVKVPVKNTQQVVANAEAPKKNIGGYVIAGAAAIFLLGAI